MSPSPLSQWVAGAGGIGALFQLSISGYRHTIWRKRLMRSALTDVFFIKESAPGRDGLCWNASCQVNGEYDDNQEGNMSKRIAAIVLALTFISLAIAPETLAQRSRRDGYNRSVNTRSYSSYPSSGVAGQRYYAEPYYRGGADTRYYAEPYDRGGAGTRYYGTSTRYYGERYYRDSHSTRDAILTIAAPAAVGAGIGAIVGGGKGAGVGALIGGGGGALFYLLKHNGRR
jgi:hypothetical protein